MTDKNYTLDTQGLIGFTSHLFEVFTSELHACIFSNFYTLAGLKVGNVFKPVKVKEALIEKAEGGALLQLLNFNIATHLVKAGFIQEQFHTFCPDCGFQIYDYCNYTELISYDEFHCNRGEDCESIHDLETLRIEVFYVKNF